MDILLCVFDLSCVKMTDSSDGVTFMNDRGSFAIGFGKNDINELFSRRNDLDSLKVVNSRHLWCFVSLFQYVERWLIKRD